MACMHRISAGIYFILSYICLTSEHTVNVHAVLFCFWFSVITLSPIEIRCWFQSAFCQTITEILRGQSHKDGSGGKKSDFLLPPYDKKKEIKCPDCRAQIFWLQSRGPVTSDTLETAWGRRGLSSYWQRGKHFLVTVAGRDHVANIAATETCSSQLALMCASAPRGEGEV